MGATWLRSCTVHRLSIRIRLSQHSKQCRQRVVQSPSVRTLPSENPHTSSVSVSIPHRPLRTGSSETVGVRIGVRLNSIAYFGATACSVVSEAVLPSDVLLARLRPSLRSSVMVTMSIRCSHHRLTSGRQGDRRKTRVSRRWSTWQYTNTHRIRSILQGICCRFHTCGYVGRRQTPVQHAVTRQALRDCEASWWT